MNGPLSSLRAIEFCGLGPAPLAGQLLADMGAQVTVIDRVSGPQDAGQVNRRGKQSLAVNLKSEKGCGIVKELMADTDIVIEGFRPGVMERLGLGPDDCPKHLIYGRMTGWGQEGPWSHTAGHDINYLAMTGALNAMGSADRPPAPPLNLVADYGGGALFLVFGLLAGVIERGISGKGQVVDAAMVDGVPAMMGLIQTLLAQGEILNSRESNWIDGAAPFYRCYECADGKYISVGALEPQFFAELLERADLKERKSQYDRTQWPATVSEFAAVFKTRTRDDWAAVFEGSDACVAPVLDFAEAPLHPVNQARGVFYKAGGVWQAQPAPRFSRTNPDQPAPPTAPGADNETILKVLGHSIEQIAHLKTEGVIT